MAKNVTDTVIPKVWLLWLLGLFLNLKIKDEQIDIMKLSNVVIEAGLLEVYSWPLPPMLTISVRTLMHCTCVLVSPIP